MNNIVILIMCILFVFILWWCGSISGISKDRKSIIKPIIIQEKAKDWMIKESVDGNQIVIIPKSEPKPIQSDIIEYIETFLIDKNDIEYYTDRYRENEIEKAFQTELERRGVNRTETLLNYQVVDTQETDIVNDLENYIIDEILGNNMVNINQRVDTQSVHDTNMQKQLKSTFNKYNNTNNRNFDHREVEKHAYNIGKSENDIAKLKSVMDKIVNRNEYITNYKESELGVLEKTWNLNDDNIKDQIINSLLDCEENGSIVCPTGTSSRIVESVYINNPENTPKTNNMYKEEMLNKAAIVRRDVELSDGYKRLSEKDQSIYLRDKLMDTYRQDYNGVLSDQDILKLTADWIDYIE